MNDRIKTIIQPTRLLAAFIARFCTWLPDALFLRIRYRLLMHKKLSLEDPITFTEKMQWLKLYDRKPAYTMMADKFAVKEFVEQRVGKQYIIPTLGVWEKFEEIDFSKLPEQFVLKSTNGGGGDGVIICTNKAKFDKDAACKKLQKSMRNPSSSMQGEWVYKGIKPKLIAEKFMKPAKASISGDLSDYKFFCFNGEPMYCQVIRDRHVLETIDFYDMNWIHQDFVGLNPNVKNGLNPVDLPLNFEIMKNICRNLAKGIPFVRVDLYDIDNAVYFGELTFYPNSGYGKFTPEEWDKKLGNLLQLPRA